MGADRASDAAVAAFLTGDPATHAEVRLAIRGVVRSFRFRSAATYEDLVQEALFRVFVNLRSGAFRGDASLRTFARRVAQYTCLEHLRRLRFQAEVFPATLPDEGTLAGPETSLLSDEVHRRNLVRLAALPPECRELFRLIFIEGLSYAGVAERLGISETAVKLRVYRCRLIARRAEKPETFPVWRHYRKEVKE